MATASLPGTARHRPSLARPRIPLRPNGGRAGMDGTRLWAACFVPAADEAGPAVRQTGPIVRRSGIGPDPHP